MIKPSIQNPSFEVVGHLDPEDTVLGVLSDNKGVRRIVAITLTEGLSDHKRRQKLSQVREAMNSPCATLIPGQSSSKIIQQFDVARENSVNAKVENPRYAGQTIDLLVSETNNRIFVFDCQNKASFWSVLRGLNIDEKTLFALAELRALKPQKRQVDHKGPVGEAHKLCASLSKRPRIMIGAYTSAEFVERVKNAVKVKLADFDDARNWEIARFRGRKGSPDNWLVRSMLALGRFTKKMCVDGFPTTKRELVKTMIESLSLRLKWSGDSMKSEYKRMLAEDVDKVSDEVIDNVLSGKGDLSGNVFSVDGYEDQESVYEITGDGSTFKINIRDGFHFLRHTTCLFECRYKDLAELKKNSIDRHFILAEQKGDEIHFTIAVRLEGSNYASELSGVKITLKDGRAESWSVHDAQTGKIVTDSNGKNFYYSESKGHSQFAIGIVAHCLNTIARMNDPDFEEVIAIPQNGTIRTGFKHAFPYFQYVLVEDELPPVKRRYISDRPGEKSRTSPLRHLVSGHPRRTFDELGNIKGITIIAPHLRGDASKGFKKKSILLANESPR